MVRIPHNRTTGLRTFPSGHGTPVSTAGTVQPFRKHEVPKTTETLGEQINRAFEFIGEA